ncbi:MAG: ABC-F family ATP-binding cassette domain-containing protein [Candidatus Aegiribacteria sp.]|nr:ABC-F family ATP-binding cassette domain-containing protein [Candidatus Aegiribacteria sp.]
MYQTYLRISNVSYTYPGSTQQAVPTVSLNLDSGWTAFTGANGCGKTTLLKLATGLLTPDTGSVVSSGTAVYCSQRTDNPPPYLDEFLFDWSSEFIRLRDILQIGDDWGNRWVTLSYGERRRLQIAAAIWTRSAVLALDEPFNHLDTDGRSLLIRSMKEYRGCGLLVSHDRHAMDELCTSCVLFFPEEIQLYRTGYTSAMKADRERRDYLVKKRKRAGSEYLRLKRDARKKMIQARTVQAHLSGKRISFKDICKYNYDGPSQYTSRVQNAGRRSREATARAERALEHMESITYRKVYGVGVELSGEGSTRNYLLDLPPGMIHLGEITLSHPQLEIHSEDRITLTGRNGTGKTTLLNHLRPELNCPEEKLIWIPQEITAFECSGYLEEAKKLSRESLGHVMTIVRRLGSDPERVLSSSVPSPGESRKLSLALGLSKTPWLVVMDEPTNHMDLPSVECLEKALNDYTGALVLVSHDRQFLSNTTNTQWNIRDGKLSVSKKV